MEKLRASWQCFRVSWQPVLVALGPHARGSDWSSVQMSAAWGGAKEQPGFPAVKTPTGGGCPPPSGLSPFAFAELSWIGQSAEQGPGSLERSVSSSPGHL